MKPVLMAIVLNVVVAVIVTGPEYASEPLVGVLPSVV
jgi:hypothetical protein